MLTSVPRTFARCAGTHHQRVCALTRVVSASARTETLQRQEQLPLEMQRFKPTGKSSVGVLDVSAEARELGTEKGISARLFYPCKQTWFSPPTFWLPHWRYASGYVRYATFWVKPKTWKTWVMARAMEAFVYILGSLQVLPVHYNAPLVQHDSISADSQGASAASSDGLDVQDSAQQLPVIIFSHGLAGNRNTYSSLCTEMASKGYLVLSIEHTDGSASMARTASGEWIPYAGLGDKTAQAAKLAHRVQELHAAHALMQLLHGTDHADINNSNSNSSNSTETSTSSLLPGGVIRQRAVKGVASDLHSPLLANGDHTNAIHAHADIVAGVGLGSNAHMHQMHPAGSHVPKEAGSGSASGSGSVNGRLSPSLLRLRDRFLGRLDLSRVSVCGHSYGGVTVAAGAAEMSWAKAAVALDPWWDPLDPRSPVMQRWRTAAPMLVLGSHDWNTPDIAGRIKCNGVNQDSVLSAAAAGGGGALLLVLRDSTHHSYDDILLLYGRLLKPLASVFKFKLGLDQTQAMSAITWSMHTFLQTHMPQPGATDKEGSAAQAKAGQQAKPQPLIPTHEQMYREHLGDDMIAIMRMEAGTHAR